MLFSTKALDTRDSLFSPCGNQVFHISLSQAESKDESTNQDQTQPYRGGLEIMLDPYVTGTFDMYEGLTNHSPSADRHGIRPHPDPYIGNFWTPGLALFFRGGNPEMGRWEFIGSLRGQLIACRHPWKSQLTASWGTFAGHTSTSFQSHQRAAQIASFALLDFALGSLRGPSGLCSGVRLGPFRKPRFVIACQLHHSQLKEGNTIPLLA